jgi:hypothetical protein
VPTDPLPPTNRAFVVPFRMEIDVGLNEGFQISRRRKEVMSIVCRRTRHEVRFPAGLIVAVGYSVSIQSLLASN